jgi:hypothetical protein
MAKRRIRRAWGKAYNVRAHNASDDTSHTIKFPALDYYSRAKFLEGTEEPKPSISADMLERWKDVKPKFVLPDTGYQVPEARDPAPPIVRVQETYNRLTQGDFWQFVETYHNVVVFKSKAKTIRFYFSGSNYFYTKKEEGDNVVRSLLYTNKERAKRDYSLGRITWITM